MYLTAAFGAKQLTKVFSVNFLSLTNLQSLLPSLKVSCYIYDACALYSYI